MSDVIAAYVLDALGRRRASHTGHRQAVLAPGVPERASTDNLTAKFQRTSGDPPLRGGLVRGGTALPNDNRLR